MLDISLISCQVDGQSKQFNCTDIRMWKKNEFDNIIHAIRVCQSVADTCVSRKHVEDIESSHAIVRILSQQMDKFWYQRCLFDSCTCVFIEGEVIVYEECEVEKNIVITGKKSFEFFDDADSKLNSVLDTI